ncbi:MULTISPECIES: hypothetical protein [Ramlibacter]|uniref:Uncharacterized protein n=1 Tax=Ramlibacter pinisoli TaxID=2682844 RepID=A0A6N8IN20_9BURK|nr:MULTISPECIES: hypothetical protein [Ramlibacter]MBA2960634.1 hypothetical protein [Ramlibacter sp. CGMCC 1.13660]MVQ27965.1 hypothetical protein [Ramlibacter pinisoli]
MTTAFAHVEYPAVHQGVARAERAADILREFASGFEGARGAATLLLAAVVAALLVVANQLVDTWTEGHLLAAWVVMWTIAFAALALLATPARRATRSLRDWLRGLGAARREAAADRKLWDVALTDARVMADISRAMSADGSRDVRAYY